MNKEELVKYVKAAVPVIALLGYQLEPDQVEIIVSATGILYALLSAVQGRIKRSIDKK